MLEIALTLAALAIALILRAEPLRRLRPLTLPLILVALAAFAHFIAKSLGVDDEVTRWTSVALVLATAFLVARGVLMVIFDWMLVHRAGVEPPRLMREVVALIVYLVLAAIILRSMGVEVTGLIATSAVMTVVVGLALQQTLGNLLAGLALVWEQRLKIGTWVEMDGILGQIQQTGWRSLILRTRLRERLLIPNSDVAAARIRILGSGEQPVAVPVRLGVAYSVPPDSAKEVFRRVAGGIPGVLSEPAPRVLTIEFADSAVVYECRLWTLTPWSREDLTDLFLTRAHAALNRAGMEIPFPQRTLHRGTRRESRDTVERRRRALAACELFSELSDEALDELAEGSRLFRFAPGEPAIQTGETSAALFAIASGSASVSHDGRKIATLGVGDFFGETAFLSGEPRTATVRAAGGPIEVVEIDESCLKSLLEDQPGLADHLAEKMAARRLEAEELRDETGALMSEAGLVSQLRKHLLRFIGR
ncbi:MAG: mechanosensitive ion channel family protein [Acidobacteriota bacterium]|jgi:small-conductance mechanosensitive channel/CRP-like cAMP-binding protein